MLYIYCEEKEGIGSGQLYWVTHNSPTIAVGLQFVPYESRWIIFSYLYCSTRFNIMTWHSNKGDITFLRLRITPNWSKYLLSHMFLLRRDGDNYFLTECAKYKEKWHEKNKCQIERHPRFADTASDKCAIPILRDATIGDGNRDNDFFRWVKTEREIAASGIMADVSSLRQVENSFEQVEFHRQFIPNL